MKSKDQKRREAIERLERKPRFGNLEPGSWGHQQEQATYERRRAEAKRLREQFGYAEQR